MEPYENKPENLSDPVTDSAPADMPPAETAYENTQTADTAASADTQPAHEYHYVRPDAGKSWQDAGYTPQNETTTPQRYYIPDEKAPKEPKEKKTGLTFMKVACLCLVCALLGGLAGGAVTGHYLTAGSSNNASTPVLESTDVTPVPTAASTIASGSNANNIYEMGCKQVVGITTEVTTTNFFGMTSSGSVSGSGFVITEDGYIMTNYHVVEDAYKGGYDVTVMVYSGEEYTASIVGFDSDNDIAVLKIEATGLDAAALGNSDSIAVGDTVYAIGNPLGELAYSMSDGMVSATDRVISTDASTSINMFQLTAAVNAGNSGGPVYNTSGQVVGVVTAKYSNTGVEGLGFAIPINDAINIANQLIQNGYVTGKAYMGITPQDISASAAQYYNMPQGAYVYSIETGSCAEKSGLKPSDIITEMDGVTITSTDELRTAVKSHSAGDTVDMKVWRSGETITLTITFDESVPTAAENDSQSRQDQPQQYQQFQQYPFGYSW